MEINIPPLRETPGGHPAAGHAFRGGILRAPRPVFPGRHAVPGAAIAWPGNVRELRNAMERAALLAHGELILPEHLPLRVRQAAPGSAADETSSAGRLEDIERQAIFLALRDHHYNRTETAKALGISRRTLTYKLRHFKELGYDVHPQLENHPQTETET